MVILDEEFDRNNEIKVDSVARRYITSFAILHAIIMALLIIDSKCDLYIVAGETVEVI